MKGEEQNPDGSLSKTSQHPHYIVLFAVLQGSACSLSFPAQHRAELANNKEMAGRGRSFSKVPLEIQGMRFTVEERKEKK